MPKLFLRIVSPAAFSLYEKYLPQGNDVNFYTIALYPLPAKTEIIKFINYLTVFIVAINLVSMKKQFKRFFLLIIFWGLCLCFYGLIRNYFIFNGEVINSFGVFGNKNHFAGYMLMVAPLSVGYAMYCRNGAKKVILSLIASFICASIFLSLSRAATVSLLFSLLLMGMLIKGKWSDGKKEVILAAIAALGMVFVLIAGINPVLHKFSFLWQGLWKRLIVADSFLGMIKDFPLFGIGSGNFSYLFPIYRKFISPVHYYYMHNDHLQLIAETGLLGGFFYFSFLYLILKDIFLKLKVRRDPFVTNMVLGGFCGLMGVIVHSFFEFDFHIPAISFLFWLILGLVYKCVNTHFIANMNSSN